MYLPCTAAILHTRGPWGARNPRRDKDVLLIGGVNSVRLQKRTHERCLLRRKSTCGESIKKCGRLVERGVLGLVEASETYLPWGKKPPRLTKSSKRSSKKGTCQER